jgi:hypothetical protein
MTTLQELTSQLDGVKDEGKHLFELDTPETDACLRLMDNTAKVLDDMRFECFMHLNATTSYVQFERLQGLVTTARDVVYDIVRTLGDPERDFEPISQAAELLDILAIHILLSQNVELLRNQSLPIEEDLNALGPSMTKVRTLLSNFRSSTRTVFTRLKNESI